MLRQRLQSGILMGVALIAGAVFLPPLGVLLVLLVVLALALLEFYALLDSRSIPHFKIVGTIGGLVFVAGTWWFAEIHPKGAEAEPLLLYAVTAAIFIRQILHREMAHAWETMAGTLLGIIYVAFLYNFITRLFVTWGEQEGRFLILFLVVVVKFTDIGAYFIGCAIGRHKLIPRISPGKSWEGVIGGVLTGIGAGCLYVHFAKGWAGTLDVQLSDALIIGPVLAVAGVLGDLVESLFKRAVGVKDSSKMIAGMGGLLDVLDSLLFAAPVLYLYTLYVMAA